MFLKRVLLYHIHVVKTRTHGHVSYFAYCNSTLACTQDLCTGNYNIPNFDKILVSVHVAKTEKIVPIQVLAIKHNRDSKNNYRNIRRGVNL